MRENPVDVERLGQERDIFEQAARARARLIGPPRIISSRPAMPVETRWLVALYLGAWVIVSWRG